MVGDEWNLTLAMSVLVARLVNLRQCLFVLG